MPKAGDRIFKREHPAGEPNDSYTIPNGGKPMGAEAGIMPKEFIGLEKLPPDHDNLVKEGWPSLDYNNSATYATFTEVTPVNLKEGTKIYRLVDERSANAGGFWTYGIPPNKAEWRTGCAVKDSWNDDGYYVEHTVGADGLKCWEGPAAGQQYEQANGKDFYLAGGTSQLFITPNSVTTTSPKLTNWPEA